MNKRNKLKVFSPESSFTTFPSDSIILNPKITETNNFEKEEKKLFGKISPVYVAKVLKFIKSFFIFLKGNSTSVILFIGFGFIIFIIYQNSKLDSEDLQMLLRENLILTEENKKLKQNKILITNICLVEHITEIKTVSKLYKYGFLRRLESDPNSVMGDNNECLSFKGNSGVFEIKLKQKEELKKMAIYHPISGNSKSAMNKFEVICGNIKFCYEYNGNGYQEFELNGFCDCIRINVITNHGEKKYTSIYRVYLFVKKYMED